jgi:hypothetical protein
MLLHHVVIKDYVASPGKVEYWSTINPTVLVKSGGYSLGPENGCPLIVA